MTTTTAAVIGAGTIGQSWARLFTSHGITVTVFDPRPDLTDIVQQIRTAAGVEDPTLVQAATSLKDAVTSADYVQENGPERPQIKQELFAGIAAGAPDHAVFATSSSAITASVIAEALPADQAARVIVGHPFNPPHLMPLVEVVPGEHTSEDTVQRTLEFYSSVGRSPVRLYKESTGFVGNRLQNAVLREAAYLVEEGIVDAADLDDAVKNSLGLRWSAVGPLEGMHLGGGEGGLRGFMKHIGPSFASIPPATPDMSAEGMVPVFEQVEAAYGQPPRTELAAKRDRMQETVLEVRGQVGEQ
ncbi:MAG: 3-hydroxyacyl-CoA dehydrogenase NAD-binding domain-containing protein [Corynebacterium sp.]|uniref:3-hydroxyacyl-CoA dehydrogenase NAD-binding domain-containing protein n=1 Tax=Corynebacterium sp. TaxID=1720 RepID=UPI002647151A|nr:3-hydroxyacyl-CoA dehydrogenase NAD-binding domain-containing protein [Corynebacterium sp.]MDN5723409.1 3-hydroxyacyl-CoA dehydrogenase NAD-binding domain-containing protein [Corynebacterium sp.]MDN6281728.1 3-hydroxyacyl-CoA dehydrogenase NAD-binding domain-containing protein [Corynebacterium sp.]MDN6304216.1 3-hydroxyacyl-CoA dehydrogenase NAD-binding domain-containing protein [Corynebacterium sp.]MDN6367513.1 3-hydroxyacyl-CoA dehydrogenase NAD-binding domain-containing protein [Corynebac